MQLCKGNQELFGPSIIILFSHNPTKWSLSLLLFPWRNHDFIFLRLRFITGYKYAWGSSSVWTLGSRLLFHVHNLFSGNIRTCSRVLNSTRSQRWAVFESLVKGAEVRPCCFSNVNVKFSFLLCKFLTSEIHEDCLPLFHQAVNFVAHCLLLEQVNALKLLGDVHVESNGRDRFLLFRYIILPSSSSKMSAQMSNNFPLNIFGHFTLGFLPPIAMALSFICTYSEIMSMSLSPWQLLSHQVQLAFTFTAQKCSVTSKT